MSYMDKEERNDFAAHLRKKLTLRNKALNKFENDDD